MVFVNVPLVELMVKSLLWKYRTRHTTVAILLVGVLRKGKDCLGSHQIAPNTSENGTLHVPLPRSCCHTKHINSVLPLQGATPLLLAAEKGSVSLAQELLFNKADPYAVDRWVRCKPCMLHISSMLAPMTQLLPCTHVCQSLHRIFSLA